MSKEQTDNKDVRTVVLGAGCFWCVEAIYERIPGVVEAVSGYAGGTVPDPTYKQVVSGETGHAEVVRISYDPAKVSLDEILAYFWSAHDPTSLNRQGADVGTQYRSVIFYTDDGDLPLIEASIQTLEKSGTYEDPIVTEIKPLDVFYSAENYHQDYFDNNPNAGYCRMVIAPKLRKLKLQAE